MERSPYLITEWRLYVAPAKHEVPPHSCRRRRLPIGPPDGSFLPSGRGPWRRGCYSPGARGGCGTHGRGGLRLSDGTMDRLDRIPLPRRPGPDLPDPRRRRTGAARLTHPARLPRIGPRDRSSGGRSLCHVVHGGGGRGRPRMDEDRGCRRCHSGRRDEGLRVLPGLSGHVFGRRSASPEGASAPAVHLALARSQEDTRRRLKVAAQCLRGRIAAVRRHASLSSLRQSGRRQWGRRMMRITILIWVLSTACATAKDSQHSSSQDSVVSVAKDTAAAPGARSDLQSQIVDPDTSQESRVALLWREAENVPQLLGMLELLELAGATCCCRPSTPPHSRTPRSGIASPRTTVASRPSATATTARGTHSSHCPCTVAKAIHPTGLRSQPRRFAQGTDGFTHVVRPGVLLVHDSTTDAAGTPFVPGDTVYLLEHLGEGTFKGWYKGEEMELRAFWNDRPFIGVWDPSARSSAELNWSGGSTLRRSPGGRAGSRLQIRLPCPARVPNARACSHDHAPRRCSL